jgi:hypothetical protein
MGDSRGVGEGEEAMTQRGEYPSALEAASAVSTHLCIAEEIAAGPGFRIVRWLV